MSDDDDDDDDVIAPKSTVTTTIATNTSSPMNVDQSTISPAPTSSDTTDSSSDIQGPCVNASSLGSLCLMDGVVSCGAPANGKALIRMWEIEDRISYLTCIDEAKKVNLGWNMANPVHVQLKSILDNPSVLKSAVKCAEVETLIGDVSRTKELDEQVISSLTGALYRYRGMRQESTSTDALESAMNVSVTNRNDLSFERRVRVVSPKTKRTWSVTISGRLDGIRTATDEITGKEYKIPVEMKTRQVRLRGVTSSDKIQAHVYMMFLNVREADLGETFGTLVKIHKITWDESLWKTLLNRLGECMDTFSDLLANKTTQMRYARTYPLEMVESSYRKKPSIPVDCMAYIKRTYGNELTFPRMSVKRNILEFDTANPPIEQPAKSFAKTEHDVYSQTLNEVETASLLQ